MPSPRGWRGQPPPWVSGVHHKRRFLFFRFVVFAAFLWLLFGLFWLANLVFIVRPWEQAQPRPWHFTPFFCLIPLIFFGLVSLLGGFFFRRIGSPLAGVMAAADAVAEGDLSVRVPENIPGEMGQLARSFNRMTSELQRAEQQRRNLTADVAHELRTPLHIIQGNLEGILDGVYQPDPDHINATLDETRLLARLVDDLQTLSLAEAGQLPLHFSSFSAADLLSDVATGFSGPAAEAGVELLVEMTPPGDALILSADPGRLEQVLSNLVVNALRYTPAGGKIFLRSEAGPDRVTISVADTGAGIPPGELPYIFDRFWRGDRARTRATGAGSGLGLAIARQLVQAHGGRINVESTPGSGTVFHIELPISSS